MTSFDYRKKPDLESFARELIEAPPEAQRRIIAGTIAHELMEVKTDIDLNRRALHAYHLRGREGVSNILEAWLKRNPQEIDKIWYAILHYMIDGEHPTSVQAAGGWDGPQFDAFTRICRAAGWVPDAELAQHV